MKVWLNLLRGQITRETMGFRKSIWTLFEIQMIYLEERNQISLPCYKALIPSRLQRTCIVREFPQHQVIKHLKIWLLEGSKLAVLEML